MTAGYSGTPLPKKLGVKEGDRVRLLNAPPEIEPKLAPLPPGAETIRTARGGTFPVILLFAPDPPALHRQLDSAIRLMAPDSALWICWPKQSSPLATALREGEVRSSGLASGLVDIKICAVDEDWSGLKFVYRLEDRPAKAPSRKK